MKRWLDLVKLLGPVVLSAIPGVPSALVPVILNGINDAERIIDAKGSEKLDRVADAAKTAYTGFAIVHDGPEPTPEAMDATIRTGISAVVQAVNTVRDFCPDDGPAEFDDPSANVGADDEPGAQS